MLPILQIQHSEKYETKNYLRMNIANFFFFLPENLSAPDVDEDLR